MYILKCPGRGPCINFFSLLSNAKSCYVAFADQDDIWLPEKLERAVASLSMLDKKDRSLPRAGVLIRMLRS